MWAQIPWVLISAASIGLVWPPGSVTGRIRAGLGQAGIAIFLAAWLWLPCTQQPRIGGTLYLILFPLGLSLFAFGLALCIRAYRVIRSVIGWGHAEPSRLVTEGVYGFVRHPIYGGLAVGLLGWTLMGGGVYAVLLSPLLFLLLRLEAVLEEKRVLEKKFGSAYLAYRARVPAFFPPILLLLLSVTASIFGLSIALRWIPLGG